MRRAEARLRRSLRRAGPLATQTAFLRTHRPNNQIALVSLSQFIVRCQGRRALRAASICRNRQVSHRVRVWRNGRRRTLAMFGAQARVGSNPTIRTLA